MALVDGELATRDSRGMIQGNGGAEDKLSGDTTNDTLQGQAAFNQYYGGEGNDTFKLVAKFANSAGAHQGQSLDYADQFAYITDFQGAGVAGGDFVNFTGFNGSTLALTHTGATNDSGTLFYYSVQDNAGTVFNFIINSVNNKALEKGDFGFY